jgi:hypothetical protein
MSRKLRLLAAFTTVALMGAGGSYSFAANGNTGSKGSSSSAPGKLPPKGTSRSKGKSLAPGKLPLKGSPGSKGSSAPGKLPPKGSSR